MGTIRPVQFDGTFELEPQAREVLFSLLQGEAFQEQICTASGCLAVEFSGLVFQPVPYSFATPHGMAREFEAYYKSPEYLIINVPANFMFKARISQRLCAIYRKLSADC